MIMILPIVLEPSPILHQRSKNLTPAEAISPQIQELANDMIETMYAKDGVGLAAPQVGESIQLCVISKECTGKKKKDLVLINPDWQKASPFKLTDMEGCLSAPRIYGEVKRYKKIKVNALGRNGKVIQFIASDLFARVVQHEVDHLQGHLFIEKAKNLREITRE